MARDHARILVSIWNDDDFRDLDVPGQHLYLLLATHPHLSYCGHMDWWPGRLAALTRGVDEEHVYGAVKTLIDAEFVLLDTQTSELLVRSYVRYDGVMDRPNMGKAMCTALGRVTSREVREAVERELGRLRRTSPMLGGFRGIEDANPKLHEKVISIASFMGTESNA